MDRQRRRSSSPPLPFAAQLAFYEHLCVTLPVRYRSEAPPFDLRPEFIAAAHRSSFTTEFTDEQPDAAVTIDALATAEATSSATAHSDGEMEEQHASSRATWEGSYITDLEIQWLRQTRRIPEGVKCRAPAGEQAPAPLLGERVVFLEHFVRGFGLPANNFFRQFLDKFNL